MGAGEWLQNVDAVVTLAIAVGAVVWGALKVKRRREYFPRVEFTVGVDFVSLERGHRVVTLNAYVENKGFVRHELTGFDFELRYARRSDPLVDGDASIGHQARIPLTLKSGSWLAASGGRAFVDPGLSTRYSHIASLPEESWLLLLHGWLSFQHGGRSYRHAADTLVAVPDTPTSVPG